jgi:hypothetical protein
MQQVAIVYRESSASLPSNSKQTRSVFVAAAGFFLLFSLITIIIPPHCRRWSFFAALKDKHIRLETIPSPKMIIIGGSNIAFGVDSTLIEKKFHVPVVNMGVCYLFGLRYILEEIKDSVKPGDTIVLIPEYEMQNSSIDGEPILSRAIEAYPPSALLILRAYSTSPHTLFTLLNLISRFPGPKWNDFYSTIKSIFDNKQDLFSWIREENRINPRGRVAFNQEGDYLGHLDQANLDATTKLDLIKGMSSEAAHLINDFNTFVKKQKAEFVLIPPPVPKDALAPSHCSPVILHNWPCQPLTVTILAKPERYAFDSSLFYQLAYHLNRAGRSLRTTLVIEDLERYFNEKKQLNRDKKTLSQATVIRDQL